MRVSKTKIRGVNVETIQLPKNETELKKDLVSRCFKYYFDRCKIEEKLDKLRYSKKEWTKKQEENFSKLNQKCEDLSHKFGFDIYSYLGAIVAANEMGKK